MPDGRLPESSLLASESHFNVEMLKIVAGTRPTRQTVVDFESARAAYHAGLAHVEESGAADDQHDHIWHRRKKKRIKQAAVDDSSQTIQAPAHNSTSHAKVSGQTAVDFKSARAAYHAGLAHVEESGAADDQHDHIWHRRKKKRSHGKDMSAG
ncbi:hypothetical protein JRO89_XS02G0246400 [Xanthoceras sorbifolium]|uniref:Uncharacterized protein n=1 Tax=Xanthoceras sorbifolium TaxID=99658 RepID=A0ABQ8IHI8_9ROSI|nr:hypothetical protein JRO89_XS02G0246400 [Xanthoceras sorbifolium]